MRKSSQTPYLAHLLGVCALVLADKGTEVEAIAALLHDALEDHPDITSPEEIAQRYGLDVLELVESCTDTPPTYRGGPKPPWRFRKEAYLAHLEVATESARRIALADKLDNLRSMMADFQMAGDALWSRFNAGRDEQVWFFAALRELFQRAGPAGLLQREFDRTASEFIRVCGGA